MARKMANLGIFSAMRDYYDDSTNWWREMRKVAEATVGLQFIEKARAVANLQSCHAAYVKVHQLVIESIGWRVAFTALTLADFDIQQELKLNVLANELSWDHHLSEVNAAVNEGLRTAPFLAARSYSLLENLIEDAIIRLYESCTYGSNVITKEALKRVLNKLGSKRYTVLLRRASPVMYTEPGQEPHDTPPGASVKSFSTYSDFGTDSARHSEDGDGTLEFSRRNGTNSSVYSGYQGL